MLRKILRFLTLTGKLRRHLHHQTKQLPKAAQCLHELGVQL
jgi:hypothetical protein